MKTIILSMALFISTNSFAQDCVPVAKALAMVDATRLASNNGTQGYNIGDLLSMVLKKEGKKGALAVTGNPTTESETQERIVVSVSYTDSKKITHSLSEYSVIMNTKDCSLDSVKRIETAAQ